MSNELVVYGSNLKFNVDFGPLATMVDKLGERTDKLEKDEKEEATKVVSEWEAEIVEKLTKHKYKMDALTEWEHDHRSLFIDSENPSTFSKHPHYVSSAVLTREMVLQMAETAKLTKVIDGLLEKITEYDNMKFNYNYNHNTMDALEMAKKKVEQIEFDQKKAKLHKKIVKTIKEFKQKMVKNKDFKTFISKAHKFKNEYEEFVSLCREKGRIARLNIVIDNLNFRKDIRELMEIKFDDLMV